MKGRLTYVHTISPGDIVLLDGDARTVEWVKRAPGRKPAAGDNLHFGIDGEHVTVNSEDPIRVVQRASA